ncbi:MAG: methyl-accepting chemotaxis protein [Yoonia sp.]
MNDIAIMTSQIAANAEEQAIRLSEINVGVKQLDQVTQQNAAMVQQSMSRGAVLTRETEKLAALIKKFQIDTSQDEITRVPDATLQLENAIADTHFRATPQLRSTKTATVGGRADENIWQDF